MITIDMLGQPCPIPVIEARKALAQPGARGVTVLVDNIVAVQNLQKMADGLGYGFSYTQNEGTNYAVMIRLGDADASPAPVPERETQPEEAAGKPAGLTILITSDQMGRGSEELGKILMKGFLFSLTQLPDAPEAVRFLNSGVKLAVEGSNALADLKALAGRGTDIRACGTCLNYYGLTEKLAVGEIADMFEIAGTMSSGLRTVVL